MSDKSKEQNRTAKPREGAKPVEIVGQTLERALDPLASAIKRAALERADKISRQFATATSAAASVVGAKVTATPGKPGLQVSPLAVPFPAIPPIAGVELASGRAGFYKDVRDDVLLMRFVEETTCGGV